MVSQESLHDYQCAISNERHFLIDPILLVSCGHCVCKGCLQNGEITLINCSICGIASELDFSKIQIVRGLKKALQLSFGSIFESIEKETSSKLNKLKSNKSSFKFKFEYNDFISNC